MGIVLIGLVVVGVVWAIFWGVRDAWEDTKEAEKRRIEGWFKEIVALHAQGGAGSAERIAELQGAILKTADLIGHDALREVGERLKKQGIGK